MIAIIAAIASLIVPNLNTQLGEAELTVASANLNAVREAISGSASAPGYLADMKHVPGFDRLGMNVCDLLTDDYDLDGTPDVERYNVATNRGWRGPYVQRAPGVQNTNPARNNRFPAASELRTPSDTNFQSRGFFYDSASSYYGVTDDLAIGDPWGNPVVMQIPPASAFSTSSDTKRWRYARIVSAGPDGTLATPRDRLAGKLSDGTTEARGDDLVLFLNRIDVYEDEEP